MAERRDTNSGIYRMRADGVPAPLVDDRLEDRMGDDVIGSPVKAVRRSDPTNVWGFILRAGEKWGPWALVSIALAAWIWISAERHEAAVKEAHSTFREVLKEDVGKPIQDLAREQKTTNDELIRIGTKLDAHLDRRGD